MNDLRIRERQLFAEWKSFERALYDSGRVPTEDDMRSLFLKRIFHLEADRAAVQEELVGSIREAMARAAPAVVEADEPGRASLKGWSPPPSNREPCTEKEIAERQR